MIGVITCPSGFLYMCMCQYEKCPVHFTAPFFREVVLYYIIGTNQQNGMSQGFWTLLICAKWPTCTKSLHTWCCSQYACSFHVLPPKMIVRNHQSSGYLQTWTRQDTLFQWKPPPAEFRQLGQYKRVVSAKISKVGPKAKGLQLAFTCIVSRKGLHMAAFSMCFLVLPWYSLTSQECCWRLWLWPIKRTTTVGLCTETSVAQPALADVIAAKKLEASKGGWMTLCNSARCTKIRYFPKTSCQLHV